MNDSILELMMIKNVAGMTMIFFLITIMINSMMVESRSINMDTAVVCRPDILPFVPDR